MLITVTTASQTLAAIVDGDATAEAILARNEKSKSYLIQNLGAYDIYAEVFGAAVVANGIKIPQNNSFVFTGELEDIYLISDGTNNEDVRVAVQTNNI